MDLKYRAPMWNAPASIKRIRWWWADKSDPFGAELRHATMLEF